jgi:hypothetical protein
VVISGKMNADGSRQADTLSRANGKTTWGEDRRQCVHFSSMVYGDPSFVERRQDGKDEST